jgi:signal transduction histidine kinase
MRATGNRRRDEGSSGLGLAITKKIVEKLHGSIEAQSEIGKGSLFTVCLPVR